MARMKKAITLILSIMMLCCVFAIFAGCSDEEQRPVMQSTDDNSSENSIQEPIYTLKQAYSNGLLTHEDLQTISDCFYDGIACLESLDEDVVNSIKKVYAERISSDEYYSKVTADDIIICNYYGIYNGYAIAMVKISCAHDASYKPDLPYEIDGLTFYYGYWWRVVACKL